MKKWILRFGLVLSLVLLLSLSVFAAETKTETACEDGTAAVTVSLAEAGTENNGYVTVAYPAGLKLTGAEVGALIEENLYVLDTDVDGLVSLRWADAGILSETGALLELQFSGEPGTYTLHVSVEELGDRTDVEDYDVELTIPEEPDEDADCPSLAFSDLDTSRWYHEGVDYVLRRGLMNGMSEDIFAPNGTTTRGQLVTILYRLGGTPAVTGENPFTDVAQGRYYTDAVIWAAENEIVKGMTETLFAPNRDITREQLVTILYRYAAYKGVDVTTTGSLTGFPDVGSVSKYAVPAMTWALETGLIQGMDGKIAPQGTAVRAQVATVIMRLCEGILAE